MVECFSSTGRVLKTLFYSRFQEFLGKQRPAELNFVDGEAPGRVTRIRFSEFQYQEIDSGSRMTEAMPSISGWAKLDRNAK